jgi:competence protein ComEA
VDQSATPWRVFDAPASPGLPAADATAANPQPAQAPAGSRPNAASAVDARTAKLAIGGVVGALVIGAIAVVVALSGSGGQVVDAPDKAIVHGDDTTGGALLAGATEVVVDVTGAVAHPGVYHLSTGSRVGDAIDAAGGFSPRVDAERVAASINLAATLSDGSQVHVPSRDEPTSAPVGASGGTAGGPGGRSGSKVNLNTASQSELEALPGIGPVTAGKIIESRATQPFTSVNDLRDRKLVGEKTFDALQALVTVG